MTVHLTDEEGGIVHLTDGRDEKVRGEGKLYQVRSLHRECMRCVLLMGMVTVKGESTYT